MERRPNKQEELCRSLDWWREEVRRQVELCEVEQAACEAVVRESERRSPPRPAGKGKEWRPVTGGYHRHTHVAVAVDVSAPARYVSPARTTTTTTAEHLMRVTQRVQRLLHTGDPVSLGEVRNELKRMQQAASGNVAEAVQDLLSIVDDLAARQEEAAAVAAVKELKSRTTLRQAPPRTAKESLELLKRGEAETYACKQRILNAEAAGAAHHRSTLTALLRRYAPQHLDDVDALLFRHRGSENQLFSELLRRFRVSPPDPYWKAVYTAFYKTFNPQKVAEVDALLHLATGKEDVVFTQMKDKYMRRDEPFDHLSLPPLSKEASAAAFVSAALVSWVAAVEVEEVKESSPETTIPQSDRDPSASPPPPFSPTSATSSSSSSSSSSATSESVSPSGRTLSPSPAPPSAASPATTNPPSPPSPSPSSPR